MGHSINLLVKNTVFNYFRATIIEQALTTDYSMPFIYSPKNKTEGNKTTVSDTTSMKGSGEGADRGNTMMIYIIMGISAALLLILGITLFVVCKRRKQRQSRNQGKKKTVIPIY